MLFFAKFINQLLLGRVAGKLPFNVINSIRERFNDPDLFENVSIIVVHKEKTFDFSTGNNRCFYSWIRLRYSTKELCVATIKNVKVLPRSGGVVLKDGRVLIESIGSLYKTMTFGGFMNEEVRTRFHFCGREESCICVGCGPFYHWLFESVPGILRCKQNFPTRKIILPTKRSRYVDESLKILLGENWKSNILESDRPVIVDEVSFYTKISGGQFVHPKDVKLVRDSLLRNLEIPIIRDKKRLYISRKKARSRSTDESKLENFFENLGFLTVILEDLPLTEQIELFSGASHVVGLHGAGLSHLIFADQCCCILELFHQHYLNDCYARLAAVMGLRYSALVADSTNDYIFNEDEMLKWARS